MTHSKSSAPDRSAELAFFGLELGSNADHPLVLEAIQQHAAGALDQLYAQIAADPRLAGLFGSPAMMQHARAKQIEHWQTLFTNGINSHFMDGAERIGLVHARIGLEPTWYIGGYAIAIERLIEGMMNQSLTRRLSGKALSRAIGTLVKTALFDMNIALSAYFKAASQERESAIGEIGNALSALADGNLDNRLSGLSSEYAQIEQDFEAMRSKMHATLTEVASAAEAIRVSSSEIARASSDLAARTEQQAAGLEETAAAMEQMTTTVQQTSGRAHDVRDAVSSAGKDAESGSEVVRQAIGAMASIESSSSQISQIVSLIDGIAFQTNLLALNAGVEAARAGDAGMGFAVVANEVRALAQRSADAAANIKELIGSSTAHVESGVSLVGQTGEALGRIAQRIESMSELATGIATASQEQASGIVEINGSVGAMDRAVQQNAAMVEQSNAAAASLSSEAARLAALVGRFSLGQQHSYAPQHRYAA